MKPVVHHDLTNSVQDFRLLDEYEAALRDLLYFYDKVRGMAGHGEGWTAAEVLRLEQIRALAGQIDRASAPCREPLAQTRNSRALEAHSRANGSGKPPKSRKGRKSSPIAP